MNQAARNKTRLNFMTTVHFDTHITPGEGLAIQLILYFDYKAEKECSFLSQKNMANMLNLSTNTISRAVTKATKRGWITSVRMAGSSRKKYLIHYEAIEKNNGELVDWVTESYGNKV